MSPLFATPPAPASLFAAPPEGEGAVGVTVEITPTAAPCTDCTIEQPASPPALPATGGEPVSILVPVALLVAGILATLWSRRRGARREA